MTPGSSLSDSAIEGLLGAHSPVRRGGWQPPAPEEIQARLPQFEITELIGRGGMGAVYKGWQRSLDRFVAIKVLPPGLEGADADFAARFKREAKAMARLKHPGIIPVHDAGETSDGLLYFVMDYVEGTDVQKLIAQRGRLPAEEALPVVTRVLEALSYAHKNGIVHRDIKPANIMVDTEGNVLVADFGIARISAADTTALTMTNMSMGTPDFMAPEAHQGMTNVDHRSDLYAVGVMLYQMLTGRLPRGRFEPPSRIVPGLDKNLDRIVDRTLQSERDARYSSAMEMRSEIEPVLARTVARTAIRAGKSKPTGRKFLWFALAVAAVLAFLVWRPLVSKRAGALGETADGTSSPEVPKSPVTVEASEKAAAPSSHAAPAWIKLWSTAEEAKGNLQDGVLVLHGSLRAKPGSQPSRDIVMRASFRFSKDTKQGPEISVRNSGSSPETESRILVGAWSEEQNDHFHLRLMSRAAGKKHRILKLWDLGPSVKVGDWVLVELRALGNQITVSANGQTLATVQSEDVMSGGGVATFGDEAQVRDVSCLVVDGLPESTVTALLGTSSELVSTPVRETPFVNSLGMKFAPVPIVGGPTNGQPVLFSVWETRVQDFEAFVKEAPRPWPRPNFTQGPLEPAVNVTWDDAKEFCAWLTARERGQGRIGPNEQYRLPTDHEWSCAVGIGDREDAANLPRQKGERKIDDLFPWGRQYPPPPKAANVAGQESKDSPPPFVPRGKGAYIEGYEDGYQRTAPVGAFTANALGLHDLGGNVCEWCEDWWDADQKRKVLRGADWASAHPLSLLSSTRLSDIPNPRSDRFGFRVVLVPDP